MGQDLTMVSISGLDGRCCNPLAYAPVSSLYLSTSSKDIIGFFKPKSRRRMSAIRTESACPVPPALLIGPANEIARDGLPLLLVINRADTTPSKGATRIPSVKTPNPAQTP